jgi:hypothetical protein
MSGTSMPSKPASAKPKSKPADGTAGKAGSGGAPTEARTPARPKPKAASKSAGAGSASAARTGTTGLAGASEGSLGATEKANPDAGSVTGAGEGTGAGPGGGERLSDAERQRRIAERAYQKAQERGFAGDRQLEDWLEAEREHNESERR